ncbi:YidC/Oxa1 family insertase periplasmic-domain containing protein [Planctomicrobium sp. SH664]|uniref:YidC/Oxa1 family insertase periplasmic-domain containing protein n=1 Tax=Planctomicrobium sp. SH664 TaxID=3448125 RepID=UPI003F5BD176
MSQRRPMPLMPLFISMGFMLLWFKFAPVLFPNMFPAPKGKNAQPERPVAVAEEGATPPAGEGQKSAEAPAQLANHAHREFVLGEPGFDAGNGEGYLIQPALTTLGAAVDSVTLTDPRYKTLDRREQLKIVGNPVLRNFGAGPVPLTFDTAVSAINEQLKPFGKSLDAVDWEVVSQDESSATFRYRSPNGNLEVEKAYRINKVPVAQRDSSPNGYLLDLVFSIRNLSDAPVNTTYSMTGPVGLPLENAENTRLFHELKLATQPTIDPDGKVTPINVTAATIAKDAENAQQPNGKPMPEWREPVRYAGADDQYFAALIFPQYQAEQPANAVPNSHFVVVKPELLFKAPKVERSEVTLEMESDKVTIPPGREVKLDFKTFFGPKRPKLLSPLSAEAVIQLGWFGSVSKVMLWMLDTFHSLRLPYWLAIILLTVVVRGLMFPISRKQAIEGEKMKILAPKLKEIQDKYKGQPEEFAKQYREFQKKYNYHPMVGCLPALFQLPILLGLYNALNHAVDLRLSTFLWVKNLAAPDALFQFPGGFSIPWLGWTEFNLLPLLAVGLMILQQKLTMPPAMSEEQRMQHNMMNVMMIVVLFTFYRVPAGLCIYFIASSLWSMVERQLLKKKVSATGKMISETGNVEILPAGAATLKPEQKKFEAPGWLGKILDAADQAKHQTEGQTSRQFNKDKKNKRSKR